MRDLVPDVVIENLGKQQGQVVDVDSANGMIFSLDSKARSLACYDSVGRRLGAVSVGTANHEELIPAVTQVLATDDGFVYVPEATERVVFAFDGTAQTLSHRIALEPSAPFANRWALGLPGQLFASTVSLPFLEIVRRAFGDIGRSEPEISIDSEVVLRINLLERDSLRPIVTIIRPELRLRSASSNKVGVRVIGERTLWGASNDGTIVVADGGRRVIQRFSSSGGLLSEDGIPFEPEVVPPHLQEQIRASWVRSLLPPAFRDTTTPALPGIDTTIGALLPPFMEMILDHDSNVWLRRPSSGEELAQWSESSTLDRFLRGARDWYVLTDGNRIGGRFRFPEGFQLTRVRGGYCYGYRNHAEGAQSIERYPVPPLEDM